MNTLASMGSDLAVNEYISWSQNSDVNIKTSAYNAMARSGNALAISGPVRCCKSEYPTNGNRQESTASLAYLCKLLLGKKVMLKRWRRYAGWLCQNAMMILLYSTKLMLFNTIVSFQGIEAMGSVFQAAASPLAEYRSAAIMMTLGIPGKEVTQKWIAFFPKASPEAKAVIITMFGIRKDEAALPLVTKSLSDQNQNVRTEAAEAVVRLGGDETVNSLINYMLLFSSTQDQEAAKSAFKTAAGNLQMSLLVPVLKDGNQAARKTAIELLAWSKGNQYFSEILPYTSSTDEAVRSAAFKALASLSEPDNQDKLIDLLAVTENEVYIADIQAALAAAAGKISDPERRSAKLLQAMSGKVKKEKIIPVLAKTGGHEALAVVLKEFENGNSDMRDICFNTLMNWSDYSASSALYEICASGNKTFEAPAFDGYLRQISTSELAR